MARKQIHTSTADRHNIGSVGITGCTGYDGGGIDDGQIIVVLMACTMDAFRPEMCQDRELLPR